MLVVYVCLFIVFFVVVICCSSGDVITTDCVEKIIRKNGMLCPLSGKTLKEKDIIHIVRVSYS